MTKSNKKLDKSWKLPSGEMAGVSWGTGAKQIIGLHGWLDNAMSFSDIGPGMTDATFTALDFPGHGNSPKKSGFYYIWEYALDVVTWVQLLNQPVHIVGHSMGAGVALIVGSMLGKQCLSISFIDGFAPMPDKEENFASRLSSSFANYQKSMERASHSTFNTWEDLVTARMASPVAPVSKLQAETLMGRDVVDADVTPLTLRHDPLLKNSSLVRLTHGQVHSLAKSLQCSCQLILGKDGMISKELEDYFVKIFKAPVYRLPGNHHLHLGENSGPVIDQISKLIDN